MRCLLFLLFLIALAASVCATQCYTDIAELVGQDVVTRCGTLWHTNERTVHASALATHGSDVLLLCSYADSFDAQYLERYQLSSGVYLDGVTVQRASATAPVKMCATNYDLFVLEADGTLSHFSRTNGAQLTSAPGEFVDIACTDSRLFAIMDGLVVELAAEDGLLLHIVVRLPAPRFLMAGATYLEVYLGTPIVFAARIDLIGGGGVVAFSAIAQSVHTDSSSACLLRSVDVFSGTSLYWHVALQSDCVQLSADVVVSEGVAWNAHTASPIDGDLFHDGNLGTLQAASIGGEDALMLADEHGRVAELTISGCNATRQSWHATLGPKVYFLSNASSLWSDGPEIYANGELLPPVGGTIFGGLVDDGVACVLLASKIRCTSIETPSVSVDFPLPDSLNPQKASLAMGSDGELMLIDTSANKGVQLWHFFDKWEMYCSIELARERSNATSVVGFTPTGILLRWNAELVVHLHDQNCTLDHTQLHLQFASATQVSAISTGTADRCLFRKAAARKQKFDMLWFRVMGVLMMVFGCCLLILVAMVFGAWRSVLRVRRAPHQLKWTSQRHRAPNCWYGSEMQCLVHHCLCCAPALRDYIVSWQQSHHLTPLSMDGVDDSMGGGVSTATSSRAASAPLVEVHLD